MKGLIKQVSWRLFYTRGILLALCRGEKPDIMVSIFFLLPGKLRSVIFGKMYLTRRLLKKFSLGTICKDGDSLKLKFLDLSFTLSPTGIEDGDVFDILIPYALRQRPDLNNNLSPYYHQNLARFFDGPYIKSSFNIPEAGTVVDAGANIGLFSVVASRLVGPHGKVYAFEPISEIADILERNIRENNRVNVRVERAALGEKTGKASLYVNLGQNFEGSSKYINRRAAKRPVPQTTLDNFLTRNGIKKVDFIKADVEGAERDLLRGALKTIKECKPVLAIRTYHLPDDPKIIAGIVKNAVPEYTIEQDRTVTLYAKKI